MVEIFVSYRREDAQASAGRLYDRLRDRFGEESVFFDVDAISVGEDYRQAVADKIASARVFVAVIGQRWLTIESPQGDPRLEDPGDDVRLEIAAALRAGLPIFPVLVEGARMPNEGDVPGDIAPFSYRNALRIDPTRFHRDVDDLIKALEDKLAAPGQRRPSENVPNLERQPEEVAEREYAERQESASAWQDLAGQLTSEFGTMTNRVEDVAAARGTLKRLQGASQSQLRHAFGRDSMVVCAERHIRRLMQAALELAEDAVKAGDTDEGRSKLRQLAQLNSSEIDTARWSVFEVEVAARREQPDRDLVQPASALDDRVKLSDAVQRHCAQRVECDLLPDREI